LDSGADTENITITGTFITDKDGHKWITTHNDNKIVLNESYNQTPPIMCLVTDAFWLFTSQNGGTVEYNTKETWDELFKKRYPSIYQRLMSEYLAKYF
jgi:hypothetical protein